MLEKLYEFEITDEEIKVIEQRVEKFCNDNKEVTCKDLASKFKTSFSDLLYEGTVENVTREEYDKFIVLGKTLSKVDTYKVMNGKSLFPFVSQNFVGTMLELLMEEDRQIKKLLGVPEDELMPKDITIGCRGLK